MAIMIPEKPRSFDPASQEGLIFDALALLPEDYYVFHSFRITDTRDGIFRESETDFVILAVTSLRPITERKPKVFEGAVKGTPAKIHFCDSVQNERERIDSIIDDLAADGYRDIALLTCKTEATSILSDSVNNGKYRNKYLFTTCRKFKGLEADVVILLDVDKTTFEQGNALIFYVGTSRARIKLEIAAILSDDDCKEILMSILNYRGKIRRAQKDLAGALNAIGSVDS